MQYIDVDPWELVAATVQDF